jgi:hypothetical protein
MDYEDGNWFKPDGIWIKVAKRRFVVELVNKAKSGQVLSGE